ncbi:MAG: NAD(P)-binding oxidoreductase [Phormidesmis sp.]
MVGASGATGRLLVEQLLNRECLVKVIVRSLENLPNSFRDNDRLSIICANVLELSDDEMVQHVSGCEAVASCLGHTMSLKGIYGQPRRLVTDAVRRLCNAIKMSRPQAPVKFVLMNTAGNRNRDLAEPISLAQKGVVGLIRLLVPPHADNEQAADYLRNIIGQNNPFIEWVAVRPDDLVNELEVSGYEVYASPTRSAIFDAGSTSRINVSHFMAELVIQDALWKRWRGKMPVIYNSVISD